MRTCFWVGLAIFIFSFFLVIQGLWLWDYNYWVYGGIFLALPNSTIVPHYISMLEEAWALVPSVVGGIVLMITGWYILVKQEQIRYLLTGSVVLTFSFVLFAQTIWCLFIYPPFYPQLYWYATTDIFMNFPIFFRILGAVIPPIVGSALYMITGAYLLKKRLQKGL